MLRALGSGMHVYYLRLLKPRWKTGELKLCPNDFHPNLTFKNVPHYWALCVSKTIPEDVATMKEKMKPEMEDLHLQVKSGKYDLIIADEPTGNLDPQTSKEIMELFKSLHQKGMTLLMATHDYQMIVKFPGKIFKCEEGKVFEVIAKS